MGGYIPGGKIKTLDSKFSFDVAVLTCFDDGFFYTLAPALDVVGAGTTQMESKASFEIILDEFIRYSYNKKTLLNELKRLGWEVSDNYSKKFKAKSPTLDVLKANPDWAPVFLKIPKLSVHKVQLPF